MKRVLKTMADVAAGLSLAGMIVLAILATMGSRYAQYRIGGRDDKS